MVTKFTYSRPQKIVIDLTTEDVTPLLTPCKKEPSTVFKPVIPSLLILQPINVLCSKTNRFVLKCPLEGKYMKKNLMCYFRLLKDLLPRSMFARAMKLSGMEARLSDQDQKVVRTYRLLRAVCTKGMCYTQKEVRLLDSRQLRRADANLCTLIHAKCTEFQLTQHLQLVSPPQSHSLAIVVDAESSTPDGTSIKEEVKDNQTSIVTQMMCYLDTVWENIKDGICFRDHNGVIIQLKHLARQDIWTFFAHVSNKGSDDSTYQRFYIPLHFNVDMLAITKQLDQSCERQRQLGQLLTFQQEMQSKQTLRKNFNLSGVLLRSNRVIVPIQSWDSCKNLSK